MMNPSSLLCPARRVLVSAVVAAVAATGLVFVNSTAANASTTSATAVAALPAMSTDSYEQQVQYWINVRRTQHGLGKLRLASCTDDVAETWGSFLASTGKFEHQLMGTILNRCNARYAGETLGRGAISPKQLVYLWMHSPDHRKILLSRYPSRVGIGAYPGRSGEWVVAADFMKF
jgi:uncharacterized protein YkwD